MAAAATAASPKETSNTSSPASAHTPTGGVQMMTGNRIVHVNDPGAMPADYSSTPGGTLYSTTPGGTRIVYERSFLMHLKNSPISRTPPKNLASFPASCCKDFKTPITNGTKRTSPTKGSPDHEESEQFQMDM